MRTSIRRLSAATALLALVGAGTVACGSQESTPGGQESSSAPASSSTSPAALAEGLNAEEGTAADPTGAGATDTAPKKSDVAEASPGLVVSAIRVGDYQGRDRVVFEFTGTGSPGYQVDYVDSPAQQGSGKPLTVPGSSFLQVNMTGQTLPTETGATEVPVGTVTTQDVAGVGGVAFAGQFEGTAQAVIGVEGGKRPFTAFTLENPTRLVVDISR